jgi:hypothetical protein
MEGFDWSDHGGSADGSLSTLLIDIVLSGG